MPRSHAASSPYAVPATCSPRRRTEAMKRLYLQFYLTIIASLVIVVLTAGALWRFAPSDTPTDRAFEIAGELMVPRLAPLQAEPSVQLQAVEALHTSLHI